MKKYINNDLHLEMHMNSLNIADTLDCGQCFRFKADNEEKTSFTGVAFNKILTVTQCESEIIFKNTTEKEFDEIWSSYFDLDTDYDSIKKSLEFDKTIKSAMDFAGGIRILKQDKFEALCSFIVSQNNNIPRIKGSIEKFSARFGKEVGENLYTFPIIGDLVGLKKADLVDLSLGYRDDYIVDCVEKITSGELDLDEITTMEMSLAREKLRTVKGIGPKVAECALLFGFHRLEAFPIDTWIKKVLATYYKDGFPEEIKDLAGIAQQYLFHYMRKADLK